MNLLLIFQAAASAQRLGGSEFLHKLFKNRASVSHSLPSLPDVSPAGFQSQTLRELVFPVQVPQAGEPKVGLGPLTPQRRTPRWSSLPLLWVAVPGCGI